MTTNEKIFCSRLKELRTQKSLTQKELVDKLTNIKLKALGHLETGRNQPSISALCELADYFDVSLDYLVGRSDDPELK